MYLFNELQIIPLIFLFLLWGIGGWLLTVRWFDLESYERGFIGFGLGLVIANWIGNFTSRFIPMQFAFWVAALLTLALGGFSAFPFNREFIVGHFKSNWTKWFLFIAAVLLFTLIGRGLGMLDDFQNLPAVSIMATGDIPPHLPGSPDVRFGYHYFLLLLGVQFMRVADAAPWTALDLARGLTFALAIVFTALLAFRLTRNKTISYLSAIFFTLAGGTRWLLLLLPISLLNRISSSLTLIGSGHDTAANLFDALSLPWKVAGSGPIQFPFAFANGVDNPSILAHNGYGVSAGLVMLLLILLAGRQKTWKAGIPITVLLASLALANEVNFVLLYIGVLVIAALWAIQNKTIRPAPSMWGWAVIIILAGICTTIQGGLITEVLRGRLQPSANTADSYFKVGFSLVPPTVISSHLGKLSLLNPLQLIAALLEIGPLVLTLPLILHWGYKALREESWIQAALAASTVPSLLSLFIEYSGNAGISATTRLFSNLFFMCKILAVPLLWLWLQDQAEWRRRVVYGMGAITMTGGIVLLSIELIAIPRPVYSDFVTAMDASFYNEYWDRLSPPSSWVFDPDSSRSPTIFGRQANSLINLGVNTPEYETLMENPDPFALNAAGYGYIYAEKSYWRDHASQLEQTCVKVLRTIEGASLSHGAFIPDFRQLADISECK